MNKFIIEIKGIKNGEKVSRIIENVIAPDTIRADEWAQKQAAVLKWEKPKVASVVEIKEEKKKDEGEVLVEAKEVKKKTKKTK